MQVEHFKLHDVSRFPVVKLSGRGLPPGYGPTWASEMEMLLAQDVPFVLIFLDSAENETHDDQKLRTKWLKANKGRLAEMCRGIFSIEPNKAVRLLKRAQGAVVAAAFGLRLRVVASLEDAEQLAALAVAGAPVPDDTEQ
jgi:hypothetical protein